MKNWVFVLISFLMIISDMGNIVLSAEKETGVIHGSVLLAEDPPDLPRIVVDKSVDFCGNTLTDPILIVEDRGVQFAVVSIDWDGEVHRGKPLQNISLQSHQCLFQPRIQATQVGAFLELKSRDEITHNPHGWWKDTKTVFNITLLNPNLKFKRELKWEGIYRVECDTHTWMKAYILVFRHPFYAVTNTTGVFVLENVPVGKHTVRVWHEILGEQKVEVVVMSGKETRLRFEFPLVDHRCEILKPKTVSPWPSNGNYQRESTH